MIFKGISRFILLFLILSNIFFKSSFGASSCIPKDHSSYNSFQVSHIFDNIVGIISDMLFGRRTTASLNIFDKYENDFGDRRWSDGLVYKMFVSTVTDGRFQVIIYLAVILYISYMGVSFALGYSEITASELITQFVKIGIILMFTSEKGWIIYLEYVVKNVIEASRELNRMIIANMYNVPVSQVTSPFEPLDMVLSFIFNGDTWTKIFALLWGKGIIFVMLLLIVLLFTVLIVFIMVGKVTIIYLVVLTLAAVLLSLGPMFMVFLLFSKTKTYFDKWFTGLVGLFLQQYMLFLGFFIFCVILTGMMKGLFYFEVCYTPVVSLTLMIKMPTFIQDIVNILMGIIRVVTFGLVKIDIYLPEFIVYIVQPLIYSHAPTDNIFGLFLDVFAVSSLLIAAMMFGQFTDMISELGNSIAGSRVSAGGIAQSTSAFKGLQKLESKAASAAGNAMKDVLTGQPLWSAMRGVSRAAGALKPMVDKAIESNANSNSKFNQVVGTKLLKGLSVGLSVTKFAGNLVQSKDQVNKMRAIESNQAMMNKWIKEDIKNTEKSKGNAEKEKIMKDNGFTSEKQLTAAHQDQIKKASELTEGDRNGIMKNAKERIAKEGHSGLFQKVKEVDQSSGKVKEVIKELPMSENPIMVEETLNSVIRKGTPFAQFKYGGFKMQEVPTADKKAESATAADARAAVTSGIAKGSDKLGKFAAGIKNERAQKFLQAMAGTAGKAASGIGKAAEVAVKAGQTAGNVAAGAGAAIQRTRSGAGTFVQENAQKAAPSIFGKKGNKFW